MSYTFKIKLKGTSKPPIWRKIKINEDVIFYNFHTVIQVAFEWDGSHLFHFSPDGYSEPIIEHNDPDDPFSNPFNAPADKASTWPHGSRYADHEITLKMYFEKNKKMVYTYDFGDNWEHVIELIDQDKKKIPYPVCLDGKGKAPLEDCGGLWGYYEMVERVNDPEDPESEDLREWMGLEEDETWDVNEFDKDAINEVFKEFR